MHALQRFAFLFAWPVASATGARAVPRDGARTRTDSAVSRLLGHVAHELDAVARHDTSRQLGNETHFFGGRRAGGTRDALSSILLLGTYEAASIDGSMSWQLVAKPYASSTRTNVVCPLWRSSPPALQSTKIPR
eukprot:3889486-Pleurochrysis_carterae.AAC.1